MACIALAAAAARRARAARDAYDGLSSDDNEGENEENEENAGYDRGGKDTASGKDGGPKERSQGVGGRDARSGLVYGCALLATVGVAVSAFLAGAVVWNRL